MKIIELLDNIRFRSSVVPPLSLVSLPLKTAYESTLLYGDKIHVNINVRTMAR